MNIKLTLNWDDQLGNDGEDLGTTLLEHVEDTLHSKEAVGVLLFADAFEEDRQVMMIIKLHNIDLPLDLVLGSVVDGDGEISSVVEASELTGYNSTVVQSTSLRLLSVWYILWCHQ